MIVLINGKLTTKILKLYGCTLSEIPFGKKVPDTCLHRREELIYDYERMNGALASRSFSTHPLFEQAKER